MSVSKGFNLREGDKLDWDLQASDNRMALVVTKVDD
ncbi:hypothetical protein BH18THE2_BH18THE2_14560 [soil metagenome]